LFAGSGVSVDSGLPTWDGMLSKFVDFCEEVKAELDPTTISKVMNGTNYDEFITHARDRTSKNPLRVASVLKNWLKLTSAETNNVPDIKRNFSKWLVENFGNGLPNDNHKFIVKTNYPYILTTNYDPLLEKAAKECGFNKLAANNYSFTKASQAASVIYEKNPSIFYLHGDLYSLVVDDFVLTSEDYVKIRKDYPGFTMAINTLFMTHSILFVGYGGSDPHLEDFMEELSYNLDWMSTPQLPKYYIVLMRDKVDHILDKYKGQLRTDIIVIDNYSESTNLLRELSTIAPRII
jgi:hypothetical protein